MSRADELLVVWREKLRLAFRANGRWRAAWTLDPEAPVFDAHKAWDEARAEEEAKKETYISPFDRRSYRYNMGQKGGE